MSHYPVLMGERHRAGQGERGWSEGLAAARLVWWFVCECSSSARSWRVVRKQLETLKQPEEEKTKRERGERERETSPDALSFCFRRGVFLSVISPDWFLSRRACKHGYQRGEGRAERADASVVYVGLKIAFPFSNWIYICLWEGNA